MQSTLGARARCPATQRAAAVSRHSQRSVVRSRASVTAKALPEALLFDCDGVLVDTERDGHRVSFNDAFKQKGLDHTWGVELYGELLEIGGGKERMTKYFKDVEDQEPFKSTKDPEARKTLVAELHKLKTDLFMQLVETGAMPLRPGVRRLVEEAVAAAEAHVGCKAVAMPLRPGVRRLVEEAVAAGVPVAVCSTSNERAVSTIVRVMLGDKVASIMRVFAGDVVPKKKPDPAIYLLAAKELGVNPARCVVVEDSRIGLQAAKAAGMTCVVTKSSYTQNEDFGSADAVHDCIGEAGEERFSLADLSKMLEVNAAA
ncbi:hypothetical protein OEZ85_000140 [Tetradesmus obliquus]|uniref:Uncharacterized protein n=1 Tax=Tetradesmus obliquus TaxID=3088 RepID=A0ABY8URU2_TETOB|nr:hypothetical protein OEZ85_000140 [Tetradesmus obliquus]